MQSRGRVGCGPGHRVGRRSARRLGDLVAGSGVSLIMAVMLTCSYSLDIHARFACALSVSVSDSRQITGQCGRKVARAIDCLPVRLGGARLRQRVSAARRPAPARGAPHSHPPPHPPRGIVLPPDFSDVGVVQGWGLGARGLGAREVDWSCLEGGFRVSRPRFWGEHTPKRCWKVLRGWGLRFRASPLQAPSEGLQ